jgi:hypothetical protein
VPRTPRQAIKCIGKRKDGSSCGAYAISGTTVCWAHGGKLPRVKAKAASNVTEARARAVMARLDVEPVADVNAALSLLAGQVLAWRDVMAEQVNNLSSLRYEAFGENSSGEQLRAEVSLWERALDRCRVVLVDIAKLDLGAKMAAIDEAKLALMDRALTAALDESGLDLATADKTRHAFARHLRIAS